MKISIRHLKKSGKKPSDFCKENLKYREVKIYKFISDYFSIPDVLVSAIKKYTEVSCVQKGENTLRDLLKKA